MNQCSDQRIVVIGGGIAGLEAALTLRATLPESKLTIVSERDQLRLLPNLVYVPFGIQPELVSAPISSILRDSNVDLMVGSTTGVDCASKTITVGPKTVAYDALVVAPGVDHDSTPAHVVGSRDGALSLRAALSELPTDRRTGIEVRVLPESTRVGAAYEFAMLLGTWLRAVGLARHTDLSVVTTEQTPFNTFGYAASQLLVERLRSAGVIIASGIPEGRIEGIDAGLVIDFPAARARVIPGLPIDHGARYFKTDDSSRIADDVFVVGDAADIPIHAGFATAWQARQVAVALGGDLARLGPAVDGVPVGSCEYQLDLGDGTLHVRFDARTHFAGHHIGSRSDVWVSDDTPQKLLGTLLRARLPHRAHAATVQRIAVNH